jgi:hypothetical protein
MPQSKPTIPHSIGELMDHLGMMMLKSPAFKDDYFINIDVDMVFFELNEGLKFIQKKLGGERYQELRTLSDKMRAHFEADPEDKTEDARTGRRIIREMEDILKSTYRK